MAAAKKQKSVRKSGSSRPPPADELVDALAEASWSDADGALAEALSHFDELEHTTATRRRRDLLDLLGQALTRAARRRNLTRFGEPGAEEAFDPERHELAGAAARRPKSVEVIARGVSRAGEVLVKARARPTT